VVASLRYLLIFNIQSSFFSLHKSFYIKKFKIIRKSLANVFQCVFIVSRKCTPVTNKQLRCGFTACRNDLPRSSKSCCNPTDSLYKKTPETRLHNYKGRPQFSVCFRKNEKSRENVIIFSARFNSSQTYMVLFYSTVERLQQDFRACYKRFSAR
jgi:hypothetical protein